MTTYQMIVGSIAIINIVNIMVLVPMLNRISKLEDKNEQLRTDMQTNYVIKADLKSHLDRIEKSLDDLNKHIMALIRPH